MKLTKGRLLKILYKKKQTMKKYKVRTSNEKNKTYKALYQFNTFNEQRNYNGQQHMFNSFYDKKGLKGTFDGSLLSSKSIENNTVFLRQKGGISKRFNKKNIVYFFVPYNQLHSLLILLPYLKELDPPGKL